ncbi:MAG: hypothetical protein M3Z02_09075 [Actinomycetota bacterium]|nr:hypothetical protein [Actinomycetota bacterium]
MPRPRSATASPSNPATGAPGPVNGKVGLPATTTGVAGRLMRSASTASTDVRTVLDVTGPAWSERTIPVLSTVPPPGAGTTVAVKRTVTDEPAASAPTAQLTVRVAGSYVAVHPVPQDAARKAVFAGTTSLTRTPVWALPVAPATKV